MTEGSERERRRELERAGMTQTQAAFTAARERIEELERDLATAKETFEQENDRWIQDRGRIEELEELLRNQTGALRECLLNRRDPEAVRRAALEALTEHDSTEETP